MKKIRNQIFTIIFILMSCVFCVFVISGCNNNRQTSNNYIETIEDLLGKNVYLHEEDDFIPYTVISTDYEGNALLLRNYMLDKEMRMNDYYAVYEQCEVDKYLNTVFLEALDENIQKIICNSSIDIVADDYFINGVSVKRIKRKIFLLSYSELGLKNNYHVGEEGVGLKLLKDSKSRIASKYNEVPSSWWLRSVDTTYDNCFYAVGPNGEIGSTDASGINGIRPAFCIPNNTPVRENAELLDSQ